MNLIYIHPQKRENMENINNSPLNIRFVAKTSDIRNLSEHITSDVETSEVAALVGTQLRLNVCCCTSDVCKYEKSNHNDGHDNSLLNCNIG